MATKVTRSARGGPVGWNLCKAQLATSIKELETTLDTGEHIPPTRRLKLRLTLTKLRRVAKIVEPIKCAAPLMSFDLTRVTSNRRRTTRKKR
jgi:hypothetical protein